MRSKNEKPQLQDSENELEVSAKSAIQGLPQPVDTCDQKGDCEAFDDDDFVTMSDTLPEIDIIFENECIV